MTAQEKAIELIETFKPFVNSFYATGDGGWTNDDEITKEQNAKEAAAAAVDLLISESNRTEKPFNFWKNVKTILETK